jgi:DNA invertase Pin-like site-specific DNA recombinase
VLNRSVLRAESASAGCRSDPIRRSVAPVPGLSRAGSLGVEPDLNDVYAALGKGDIVVVARLDRLARDLLTQEFLLRDIRQRGADLISCSPAETDYLAALSPRQRAAVVLTDLLDFPSEQAARMLGIRASTVRMHVSRAHAALKETMPHE